jgi:hypothetical protein
MKKIVPLAGVLALCASAFATNYSAPSNPGYRALAGDPLFYESDVLQGTIRIADDDLIQVRTPEANVFSFPAFYRYTFHLNYAKKSEVPSEIVMTINDLTQLHNNMGAAALIRDEEGGHHNYASSFISFVTAPHQQLQWDLMLETWQPPSPSTDYEITYQTSEVPVFNRGAVSTSFNETLTLDNADLRIEKFTTTGTTSINADITATAITPSTTLAIMDSSGNILVADYGNPNGNYHDAKISKVLPAGNYYLLWGHDYFGMDYNFYTHTTGTLLDRKGVYQTVNDFHDPIALTLTVNVTRTSAKK